MWRKQGQRRPIERRLDELFREYVLPEDVLQAFELEEEWQEADRALARRLASAREVSGEKLASDAWRIVRTREHTEARYQDALKRARAATRRIPESRAAANTLAWALYRMQRFEEALQAIDRAEELNDLHEKRLSSSHYEVLRGLASLRLGRREEGQAILDRLFKTPGLPDDVRLFLGEARLLEASREGSPEAAR